MIWANISAGAKLDCSLTASTYRLPALRLPRNDRGDAESHCALRGSGDWLAELGGGGGDGGDGGEIYLNGVGEWVMWCLCLGVPSEWIVDKKENGGDVTNG